MNKKKLIELVVCRNMYNMYCYLVDRNFLTIETIDMFMKSFGDYCKLYDNKLSNGFMIYLNDRKGK